jgi:glucose-1-phosphate cytidylyltransferase
MVTQRKEDVVILCGGRGARLQEHASSIPKPLVEIGGRPILWHVIRIYAAHGFRRFVLLTGHRSEVIDEFAAAESWPDAVTVETLFTGEDTPTGGRIDLARERLSGGTFCVTYADGVADIDLGEELRFHGEHGGLATMAVVRPELQFGVTELNGDGTVKGFREKPRSEHWINGGFFVFEPGVIDLVDGDDESLEQSLLVKLTSLKQLAVYQHYGFWQCMDTPREMDLLNEMWRHDKAAWAVWR